MEITKTDRGFDIIEFIDIYRQKCSIQKSSVANKDCIWFGMQLHRMHLTREQVAELLPFLQRFVETGEIIEP